jgi:hypothetical protein
MAGVAMTDLFGLEQQPKRIKNRPEAAALLEVRKALRTHPLVAWAERQNSWAATVGNRFIRFCWPGCAQVLGLAAFSPSSIWGWGLAGLVALMCWDVIDVPMLIGTQHVTQAMGWVQDWNTKTARATKNLRKPQSIIESNTTMKLLFTTATWAFQWGKKVSKCHQKVCKRLARLRRPKRTRCFRLNWVASPGREFAADSSYAPRNSCKAGAWRRIEDMHLIVFRRTYGGRDGHYDSAEHETKATN